MILQRKVQIYSDPLRDLLIFPIEDVSVSLHWLFLMFEARSSPVLFTLENFHTCLHVDFGCITNT